MSQITHFLASLEVSWWGFCFSLNLDDGLGPRPVGGASHGNNKVVEPHPTLGCANLNEGWHFWIQKLTSSLVFKGILDPRGEFKHLYISRGSISLPLSLSPSSIVDTMESRRAVNQHHQHSRYTQSNPLPHQCTHTHTSYTCLPHYDLGAPHHHSQAQMPSQMPGD